MIIKDLTNKAAAQVSEENKEVVYEQFKGKIKENLTFGEAPQPYFKGNRKELRAYLKSEFNELYKNLFCIRLNRKDELTHDWFNSFAADVLQELLASNGFTWEREIVIQHFSFDEARAFNLELN